MTRPFVLPKEVIGDEAIKALRAAGWIVVREDAIRLAQAMERVHCMEEGRRNA